MSSGRPPLGIRAANRYAHLVAHRFGWMLAAGLALTVGLAAGLPGLEFSSSQDTMIPSGSPVARDNHRYQRAFGGDPMIVLLEGDIAKAFTPHNRRELARLERDLARDGRFHAVISPETTLRFAADQIPISANLALGALSRTQDAEAQKAADEAAKAGASAEEQQARADEARARTAEEFTARNAADAARLGAAGEQSIDNPAFVEFLVFDDRGRIRPSFTGVFPDRRHALFVARVDGGLAIDEAGDAGARLVELTRARDLEGLRARPTGSPLLLKEIDDGMRTDMARMGGLALAVMAFVLVLVLRVRWRLLALPIALVGIVWAFGTLGFLGIPLSMVTISGLPILIGLGVDFAVQAHSRYEEEAPGDGGEAALARLLATMGPALVVAVGAAIAGFLALRISQVPMIRDFGVMLAVGAFTLFAVALTVVPAALAWRDRRAHPPRRLITGTRTPRSSEPRPGVVERVVVRISMAFTGHPRAVLAVVILLTAAGAVAQQRTAVESDPERFVPQDSPVLADLRRVRAVAQSSGDFGLMVRADDVMRADVLEWMDRFERIELERHPRTLFRAGSIASTASKVTGAAPTPDDVETIFSVAPPAIIDTFIVDDHRTANVLFAIGPVSLTERSRLIDNLETDMRGDLRPPEGVSATASGLAVVGIAAVDALSANRWQMALAAMAGVLVWLLIAIRKPVPALLALAPVLAALGGAWSLIYALGISVNSLSALSSPLVVAVGTEFGVLVVERHREERARGATPDEATAIAAARIGRAFVASGLATAGGFGVLAISGFPLLANFGAVVAIDLLVTVLSALVVLPPLLRAADAHLGGAAA